MKQNFFTHHPGDATAFEVCRDQHAIAHQEQIAEYAFNHAPCLIEHQAFSMLGVLPLGTGEDLLQAIQMLEASEQRLI
ncbi:hypothetical protein D3C76_1573320 [compost metagenome]